MDSKFVSSWRGWSSNEPAGPYGVGVWNNIRTCLGYFVVIPDLRWKMIPRLGSGMIFGVGI